MARSESIAKLSAALAKVQGEMRPAKRAAKNERLGNDYADLAAVWDACRAPLSRYDLAVVQLPSREGACVSVETILSHLSGEWISCTPSAVTPDEGPQAVAAATTYLRRVGLMAITGVVAEGEDDDGEAVTPQGPPAVPAAPKPKRASRAQPEKEAARTVVSPPPNLPEEKARAASLVSMVSEGGGSLRARAARLWASAERLGWGQEQFRHFAKSASGSEAPSNEWTETDLVRIEAAMAREGGEDVPF